MTAKVKTDWDAPPPPEVVEAMREAKAAGLFYNDDTYTYCAKKLGYGFGDGHHGVTREFGLDCYKAGHVIDDEALTARIMELLDAGYEPLADVELVEGERYTILAGIKYSGHAVATYARFPMPVRVGRFNGHSGLVFIPKGGRTRGYSASGLYMVRKGW